MKKIMFTIILGMFLISLVSALDNYGTFENGETIRITQVCSDATYINISSISNPKSQVMVSKIEMTSAGSGEYYYEFTNTTENGRYDVRGISDGCEEEFATYFKITPNGEEISTSKVSLYLMGEILLLIFFILSLIGIFIFDDYKGRFALYWICHILFVAISFIGWDFTVDYLTDTNFIEGMFKILFYVSTFAIFPMLMLSLAWIFYIHTMNKTIRSLAERGVPEDEAEDRARRKFKW